MRGLLLIALLCTQPARAENPAALAAAKAQPYASTEVSELAQELARRTGYVAVEGGAVKWNGPMLRAILNNATRAPDLLQTPEVKRLTLTKDPIPCGSLGMKTRCEDARHDWAIQADSISEFAMNEFIIRDVANRYSRANPGVMSGYLAVLKRYNLPYVDSYAFDFRDYILNPLQLAEKSGALYQFYRDALFKDGGAKIDSAAFKAPAILGALQSCLSHPEFNHINLGDGGSASISIGSMAVVKDVVNAPKHVGWRSLMFWMNGINDCELVKVFTPLGCASPPVDQVAAHVLGNILIVASADPQLRGPDAKIKIQACLAGQGGSSCAKVRETLNQRKLDILRARLGGTAQGAGGPAQWQPPTRPGN